MIEVSAVHRPPGWRKPLAAVLAIHLMLAALFSLVMPLGEAPDEADHYAFVVYLGQHAALPSGPAVTQSKHPPLYHGLGAAFTAWTGLDFTFLRANPDAEHGPAAGVVNHFIHTRQEDFPWRGGVLAMRILRLFSIALSTVSVWGVFHLARLAAPTRPRLALASAAFAGLLPGFLFSSGAVNNDNLAAALGTLILVQALRIVRTGWARRRGLLLGVLLGFGLLSKVGVLALWPAAATALLLPAAAPGEDVRWPRRLGLRALTALAPAALLAAPWLLRNWRLYGDPFGWSLVRATVDVREGPVDWGVLVWLAQGLFKTFWGKFGAAGQIEYPAWLYGLLLSASLAALLGLCGRLLRLARGGAARRRTIAALLGLAVILSLVTLVQYNGIALGADQARLLWPIIGPLALAWMAGLQEVARWLAAVRRALVLPALPPATQGRVWLLPLLALGALALAATFGFIRPAYGRPALSVTPAGAAPIAFGDDLALLAAQVDDARHAPGEPVTVTLTWQARRAPGQDWRVTTALRHPDDDALLADHTNAPTHGRWSTDRWRAGDLFQDVITLRPPAGEVRPSRYTVVVQVRAFGAGDADWLPVQGGGTRLLLSPGVPIAPADLAAPLQGVNTAGGETAATFEQGLALQTVSLSAKIEPGQPVSLTLIWAARKAPALNLTVFVHLLGPDGALLAQVDRAPAGEAYPTSLWRPGEGSRSDYALAVPHTPGPFELIAGLYHAPSGRRMSAFDTSGRPMGDAVRLK